MASTDDLDKQLHINRNEIEKLKARYDADERWLRKSLEEIKDKLDRNSEETINIKNIVRNGLSTKVGELYDRVKSCEDELDTTIKKEYFDEYKEEEEKKEHHEFVLSNRRKDDTYKTVAMVVSMGGMLISLVLAIITWLSL